MKKWPDCADNDIEAAKRSVIEASRLVIDHFKDLHVWPVELAGLEMSLEWFDKCQGAKKC